MSYPAFEEIKVGHSEDRIVGGSIKELTPWGYGRKNSIHWRSWSALRRPTALLNSHPRIGPGQTGKNPPGKHPEGRRRGRKPFG